MTALNTRTEIEQLVFDTLVSFEVAPEAIVPEASLKTLDVDSLDVVELADILRQRGIDIEARDFIDVSTYREFLEVILRRAGVS